MLSPSMMEVYLVTDRRLAGERSEEEIVRDALLGGVRVLQYREKEYSTREQITRASRLCSLARRHGAVFLVNDRVDLALAVDADGVHMGQEDLPLPAARRILGLEKIIGVSVENVEQAVRAEAEGADYLGVSAIYSTPTKLEAPAVGLEGLKAIRRAVKLPLVAIGGINRENAAEVIRAGADGIAVVSAVVSAPDPREASLTLIKEVRRAKLEGGRC